MKGNKIFWFLLTVIVAAGAATFFYLQGGAVTYVNVIPKDATAIGRFDCIAFLREADLSAKEIAELIRRKMTADEEQELGISVRKPVYGFVTRSGYAGLVAKVEDEQKLSAYCESLHGKNLASEVVSQRGFSWVVLAQQWLLAYDATRALVMGPAVGSAQDQLRTEMARLLQQDKSESVFDQEIFAQLKSCNESLAAVLSPEVLPAEARGFLHRFHVYSREDALLTLTLEAKKNVLEMDADIIPVSEEVKEELERIEDLLRPINGEQMEYAHSKNLFWLALNVEGKTLHDMMRSNSSVRTTLFGLNFVIDADRIVQTVDGDVTVELTSANSLLNGDASAFKDIHVTAKVDNTDFLDGASAWGNRIAKVHALTPSDFVLSTGGQQFFFGVTDNIFYVAPHHGLKKEGNAYLNEKRFDIKGSRFFASMALKQLSESNLTRQYGVPVDLGDFERLNISMNDGGEFMLELVSPKGTNIAKQLLMHE